VVWVVLRTYIDMIPAIWGSRRVGMGETSKRKEKEEREGNGGRESLGADDY
jgi:hypothetical protein